MIILNILIIAYVIWRVVEFLPCITDDPKNTSFKEVIHMFIINFIEPVLWIIEMFIGELTFNDVKLNRRNK